MPPLENNPWRLSHSAEFIVQLKLWIRQAAQIGISQELIAGIKHIHENLQSQPLEWGDPLHRLKHLNLLICHRLYRRIYTTYGVHENEHTVFIQHIRLISGHPLSDDD